MDNEKLTIFKAAAASDADGRAGLLHDARATAAVGEVPRLELATLSAVMGNGDGHEVEVYIAGHALSRPEAKVLLRCQGGYLPVLSCEAVVPKSEQEARLMSLLLPKQQQRPSSSSCLPLEVLRITADCSGCPGGGLAMVEVQAPGEAHLLSNWLPVLLLAPSDAAVAEEVRSLLQLPEASVPLPAHPRTALEVGPLLLDYGRLVDHVQAARLYIDANLKETDAARTERELSTLLAKAEAVAAFCDGAKLSEMARSARSMAVLIGQDLHTFIGAMSAQSLGDSAGEIHHDINDGDVTSGRMVLVADEQVGTATVSPGLDDSAHRLRKLMLAVEEECSMGISRESQQLMVIEPIEEDYRHDRETAPSASVVPFDRWLSGPQASAAGSCGSGSPVPSGKISALDIQPLGISSHIVPDGNLFARCSL